MLKIYNQIWNKIFIEGYKLHYKITIFKLFYFVFNREKIGNKNEKAFKEMIIAKFRSFLKALRKKSGGNKFHPLYKKVVS